MLDGNCCEENVKYNCTASVVGFPKDVYLGAAERDSMQRFITTVNLSKT